MTMNEAETRINLIDPKLRGRGWTEDLIQREQTSGPIQIINGKARQGDSRSDYTLSVRATPTAAPLPVALIEAKAESLPPTYGLEQVKNYAERFNVGYVFATNGHLFVEYDSRTKLTSDPQPLADFPTPAALLARYQEQAGFSLSSPAAAALLAPYSHHGRKRRYYQDAAIRAVLEKIARCHARNEPPRALLSLATGAGKTFIAVQLIRRIAAADQLRKVLFICDRDELRNQAVAAFQNEFGDDAREVTGDDEQPNARILIATYQTLDIASEVDDANFLTTHYQPGEFSHIIIDECHRSAWNKWRQVLTLNPDAVQIGLTATPRQIEVKNPTAESLADVRLLADNIRYFGEPVYEYTISQGVEDGYLAACEVHHCDTFLDRKPDNERVTGVEQPDLTTKQLTNARTGAEVNISETRARYEANAFENSIVLIDRVNEMCADLFAQLEATGGPEQKTIIFCASDLHAELAAIAMNQIYARWCAINGQEPVSFYAFKCTAASSGNDYLPELRDNSARRFVATTVDLLTTGVDVPAVRNIVFFKYVKSPIAFYQMMGRGTRIDLPSEKLMFRLYDYTNATRLFGEEFLTKLAAVSKDGERAIPDPDRPPRLVIKVNGFDVEVTEAGRSVITIVDGQEVLVPIAEYERRLALALLAAAPTITDLLAAWLDRERRTALLDRLHAAGYSAELVRELEQMDAYDLYDVLAKLGYNITPRKREERVAAFVRRDGRWLNSLPGPAAATITAIARQFALAGIEALEDRQLFDTPAVLRAGGFNALGDDAKALVDQTKASLLAA